MTTRLTSRISPRLIRGLRFAWMTLALYLFITWIPRMLVRLDVAPGQSVDWLNVTLQFVTFVSFAAIALLLYWRRGDDWLALYTGMLLLTTAYGYTGTRMSGTIWAFASFWVLGLMETMQVVFFYIFPDGKFLPSWVKWFVVPFFIFRVLIWENIYRNNLPQGALEVGFVVLLLLIGVGLQIYRYRRHATPVERQQVKWLLVGFTATILIVAPSIYVISIYDLPRSIVTPVIILRTLALLLVPISLGISVTRYRLWELDLTINRSVKGVITGVALLIVFAAVFFATQALIQALFGPQSAVFAIAAGAIVAVALFIPVRGRVVNFIDRRLYDLRFDLQDLRAAQKQPEVKKPGALTGQQIGDYQILDVLGRGGMGEVYKGFGGDERVVAVKIMPPEIASQDKNALRFDREIEALKQLDHPNVIHMLDAGTQGDMRYMVMDYVEGQTITQVLREHGPFAPSVALDVLKQVAAALTYIHGQQQIHRDVTSGNIMLRENGDSYDAILMDFGLVKLLTTPTNITMSGDVMGTIDYMAPEQIVQTQTVDHRSDIYALATVYYEMLSGKRPFSGGPAQVLFAHLYQPPPDIRQAVPTVPKPLAAVISRALAKTPDERFATVAEFIAAIDDALAQAERLAAA